MIFDLLGVLIVEIRVCKNTAEECEKRKIGALYSVVSVRNYNCKLLFFSV
jgi:hypothetical protein